ncbi:MAG TPA: hypothetical protein VNS09_18345 [Solirubrobacter sp.]|nr:hypothetical protein [Solirubrobacter sp.]
MRIAGSPTGLEMWRRAKHPSADRSQEVRIASWRRRRLEAAGFDGALAEVLAGDPRTDVHALLELVDRGCPPALAARILAPLDAVPQSEPSS